MKQNTFYKKVDAIRKKAINATANVLSAPAQIKAGIAKRQADSDVKILKGARAGKGSPRFNSKGEATDAWKYESLATDVRARLGKKK